MKLHPIIAFGMILWIGLGSSFADRPTYTAYRLAKSPVIDGDLSDWPSLPVLFLGQQQHVAGGTWSGPDDCNAMIRIGWDDKAMYFAARITDNQTEHNAPDADAGNIWNYDSIQWAMDIGANGGSSYDGDDYEYGFGRTVSGPCVYRWQVSASALVPGRTTQVPLAIKPLPNGKGVVYEAAVPWGQLLPLDPQEDKEIGFSVVVQDSDGGERKNLQWTQGIITGKTPEKFGRLVFSAATVATDNADVLLSGRSLLGIQPERYSVQTPGLKGNAKLDWRLVNADGKVTDRGSIAKRDSADGGFHFNLTPEKYPSGEYTLSVRVAPEGKEKPLHSQMEINCTSVKQIAELQQTILTRQEEIRKRIAQAKEKEIETAYAVAALTVSEIFEPFVKEDVQKNRYHQALQNVLSISTALKEQTDLLEKQLKQGPDAWRAIPRPNLSDIRIEGTSFLAEGEPIMLVGPMTFLWEMYRDREKFGRLGFNTIRIGLEPVTTYDDKGQLRTDNPWGAMRECISVARQQNMAVATHTPLYKQVWASIIRRGNVGFDDLHREFTSYVDQAIREIGPGQCFLHEISVEGQRAPARFEPDMHLKAYRDWLREEYKDIKRYNQICGTSFADFDQVTFPDESEKNSARKFDRTVFLQRIIYEEMAWAASVVRKKDPRAFLAGYPSWLMMDDEADFHYYLLDAEEETKIYDICDADTAGDENSTRYAMDTIHWLAMYRDLMVGLAPGKPQWDGEFHFVNELHLYPKGWTAAMHFQAYLHGLSGTHGWHWIHGDGANTAILHDAQVCLDYSATALDLRRLSKEITAFHAAPAKTAILYSQRSTPYSPTPTKKENPGYFGPIVSTHLRKMRDVYEGLFFEGVKLTFVTERQIEAGRLDEFTLLIVPAASHVSDEVVEKVQQFARQGGKVILLGECFAYDHRSQPRAEPIRGDGIHSEPAVANDVQARKTLAGWLDILKLRPPIHVEITPNNPPTVEWRYARDAKTGRELLYLLNIGHDPVKVSITRRDGSPVSCVDLRTGQPVGSNFSMSSLQLHILQVHQMEKDKQEERRSFE